MTWMHSEWATADVAAKEMTDGITNSIVRCTHGPSGDIFLVRIYGINTEASQAPASL